jgi:hypothetical protein
MWDSQFVRKQRLVPTAIGNDCFFGPRLGPELTDWAGPAVGRLAPTVVWCGGWNQPSFPTAAEQAPTTASKDS